MDFPVRKGLETPLKVHGMNTKYFIVFCAIVAVLGLVIVSFLTNTMSGKGSFVSLMVAFVIASGISIALRVVFINLSTDRKYNHFKKRIFVISNKDLLQNL